MSICEARVASRLTPVVTNTRLQQSHAAACCHGHGGLLCCVGELHIVDDIASTCASSRDPYRFEPTSSECPTDMISCVTDMRSYGNIRVVFLARAPKCHGRVLRINIAISRTMHCSAYTDMVPHSHTFLTSLTPTLPSFFAFIQLRRWPNPT